MTDSPAPSHLRLLPILFLLGANWGLAFSIAKFGALGGVAPLGYAAWQMLGAGLLLLTIAWRRGHVPPIAPAHLRFYALNGIFGFVLPSLTFLVMIRHVPVGVTALVVTMAPLLTYGFSVALGYERFVRTRAVGVVLGLIGALTILLPRTGLPEPGMAGWVAFGFLSPICYAVSNIYMARARPPGSDSMALGGAMQLCGAAVVLPLAVLFGDFYVPAYPFAMGEYAILGAIVMATFGSIAYLEVIRIAGAVFLSQVGYIVTLTGVAWGWLLFDERHSGWFWVAAATISLGLALVTRTTARG